MAAIPHIVDGIRTLIPLCEQGFGIVKEIVSIVGANQLALDRIRAQRDRFGRWRQVWADKTGRGDVLIEQFTQEDPVTARRILHLLMVLCCTFCDVDALHRKYDFLIDSQIDHLRSMDIHMLDECDPINADVIRDFARQCGFNLSYIKRAAYIENPYGRWVALISPLRNYTDLLRQYGPSKRIIKLEKGEVDEIETLGQQKALPILRRMVETFDHEAQLADFPNHTKMYIDLALAARFRVVVDDHEPRKTSQFNLTDLVFSHTEGTTQDELPSMAVLQNYPLGSQQRVVLIEWMRHPDYQQRRDSARELARVLGLRKPSSLLLPGSYGYVEDPARGNYGIILTPPPHIRNNPPKYVSQGMITTRRRMPISLRNLIEGWHPLYPGAIDLGVRFEIAKKLMDSVHTMHGCGWLHENIRSSIVLFFPQAKVSADGKLIPTTDDPAPVDFGKPMFVGFDRSRADAMTRDYYHSRQYPYAYGGYGPGATLGPNTYYGTRPRANSHSFTLDYYQHPDKVEGPMRLRQKVFDLYSLGCVLLEIGLWKTADRRLGSTAMTNNPKEIQSSLLALADELHSTMGSVYAGVVTDCLGIRGGDLKDTVAFETSMAARLSQCNA